MSESNGNTLKYRVEQVEICCKANKLSIENMAFLLEYADQIRGLKIMEEILARMEKKDEKRELWQRKILYLMIGTLFSGVSVIIITLLFQGG